MKVSNQDRLIKGTEARKLLGGISATTLWRRIKDGSIHKPIKLGGGSTNFFKESWITGIINGEVA